MELEDEDDGLVAKKAFFATLDSLDNDDDNSDPGVTASMDAAKTPFHKIPLQAPAAPIPGTPGSRNAGVFTPAPLKRGRTLPDHIPSSVDEDGFIVKETPTLPPAQRLPPTLKHSVSVPSSIPSSALAMSSATRMTGKRKRTDPVVPEAQRIFAGMRIFFVPNNNVSKARKLKIDKAVQYGATWAQVWNDSVTHVVVDKELNYNDVLKVLRVPTLPQGVILVNDAYPADCLAWKMLVDPTLVRFEIKGRVLDTRTKPSPFPVATSQASLQIKAVKKKDDVLVYDAPTPSRTDEDSTEVLQRYFDLEQGTQAAQTGKSTVTDSEDHAEVLENSQHNKPKPGIISNKLANKTEVGPDRELSSNIPVTTSTSNDPLQDAIAKAKAVEHLPINSDDEDASPQISASDSLESFSETEKRAKAGANKKAGQNQGFACIKEPASHHLSTNPNAKTIEVLQEMATYYDATQDQWRTLAYRKAVTQLRKQPTLISTKEEAITLPFVGSRLAAKIEEIVLTNRLRRLESTKLDPDDQVLRLFTQIYGVGHSQASKWLQQGFKTLDDLVTRAKLTANQRIGIAHFDDFLTRIPRAEVAQHGEIVRIALQKIDPAFEVTVGGSYRRGSKDSGDVDLLITKPGASCSYLRSVVLDKLVPQLFKQDHLTAALAVTSKDTGSKWHGACHLPATNTTTTTTQNPWRRIDLLLVPPSELGAAMIYFTGNDIFNRSMRLLARKKGMRLNQKGLYKDIIRGPGQQKMTEGVKVAGADEREIFGVLGVPWREAVERNC